MSDINQFQSTMRKQQIIYFLYRQYYKIIVIGKSDQTPQNKKSTNKEAYLLFH